jgi:hypothetical protein
MELGHGPPRPGIGGGLPTLRALGGRRSWRAPAALTLFGIVVRLRTAGRYNGCAPRPDSGVTSCAIRDERKKLARQSLTLHSYLTGMYSVNGRSHIIMIAHRFRGEVSGQAQKLHDAIYVMDIEFCRPTLNADGIVGGIGQATAALQFVLGRPASGRERERQHARHAARVVCLLRDVRRTGTRRFGVRRSKPPGSGLGGTP